MQKKTIILLAILSPLGSAPLFAGLPSLVDDATVVEAGQTEAFLFYEFTSGPTEGLHAFPIEISYGLHRRADVTIGFGYQILHDRDLAEHRRGALDSSLALKFLAIEQGGWPFGLTMEGLLTLPTASKSQGLGSGDPTVVRGGVKVG